MKLKNSLFEKRVKLDQMVLNGEITERQLTAFMANPKQVMFPYRERRIGFLEGHVQIVRLADADTLHVVQYDGSGEMLRVGPQGARILGATLVRSLEDPAYVGVQPYLLSNEPANSTVVTVSQGKCDSRNLSGPLVQAQIAPGMYAVIGDGEHGQRQFVLWTRGEGLSSFTFTGVAKFVGSVLALLNERKFIAIGERAEPCAFPEGFPDDCEFLEGVHHRGYMAILVRRRDDGRYGLVTAYRGHSEGKWLPQVTSADGLRINGNCRPFLRMTNVNGTVSMFNGLARIATEKEMSTAWAGDATAVFVVRRMEAQHRALYAEGPGLSGVAPRWRNADAHLEEPSAFPFVKMTRVNGLKVEHDVVQVDSTGRVTRIIAPDLDEIISLEHRDGRAVVIAKKDGGWLGFHDQVIVFRSSEEEIDWRKLVVAEFADQPERSKIVMPVKRGNRWQVTDGEMDFGPTLTEVLTIDVELGQLKIVGRDGRVVKTYETVLS